MGHGAQGVLLEKHGAPLVAGQRRPGDCGQVSVESEDHGRRPGSEPPRQGLPHQAADYLRSVTRMPPLDRVSPHPHGLVDLRGGAQVHRAHRPALGQHEADVAACPALPLFPPDLRVALKAGVGHQVKHDGVLGKYLRELGMRALFERLLAGKLGNRLGQFALESLLFC